MIERCCGTCADSEDGIPCGECSDALEKWKVHPLITLGRREIGFGNVVVAESELSRILAEKAQMSRNLTEAQALCSKQLLELRELRAEVMLRRLGPDVEDPEAWKYEGGLT